MRRNITVYLDIKKVKSHEVVAKACHIYYKAAKGERQEVNASIVAAVDLRGSKALRMASGDFGIAIFNELNFGFVISWKDIEKSQEDLKISEEIYEEYLDSLTNDFIDAVISSI